MRLIPSDRHNAETLFAFARDFGKACQTCEQQIVALENQPQNPHLVEELQQSLHSILRTCERVDFRELCLFINLLDKIVAIVIQHELEFDDMLSDVLLLSIGVVRAVVAENVDEAEGLISASQFKTIGHALGAIIDMPLAQKPMAVHQALALLDPHTHQAPQDMLAAIMRGLNERASEFNHQFERLGVVPNPDLDFMALLAPALERRSPYWHGRTERIATLCLTMNDFAQRPVDANQLLAAIYMHDVAMAFLPLSVLHKTSELPPADRELVEQHVAKAQQLLQLNPGRWTDAETILLQHHERCDGKGYPRGLTDHTIVDGAKILAIADAFDACKYGRAYHKELNRPLLRVILEINHHAGTQFSPRWVDVFNRVIDKNSLLH